VSGSELAWFSVSCFSKIQIGFTFLVPAHLGSPGQRAVKRLCMCIYSRAVPNILFVFYSGRIVYSYSAE